MGNLAMFEVYLCNPPSNIYISYNPRTFIDELAHSFGKGVWPLCMEQRAALRLLVYCILINRSSYDYLLFFRDSKFIGRHLEQEPRAKIIPFGYKKLAPPFSKAQTATLFIHTPVPQLTAR